MKKKNKAMGPVVAVALLLVVTTLSVVSFQNWFDTYSGDLFTNAEIKSNSASSSSSGINTVIDFDLYFKVGGDQNLSILNVKLDGNICQDAIVANLTPGIHILNITDCVNNLTTSTGEISVFTENAIYTKSFYFKKITSVSAVALGGGSVTVGNLTIEYNTTNSCSVGSTKILGYYQINNSHVQNSTIDDAGRSLCLTHDDYTLGIDCLAAINTPLFYIGNYTNSHIYFDNSSAHPATYDWEKLCISGSGGSLTSIDIVQNVTSMVAQNYSCLLSYAQNDTYGGMIGECVGGYSDKLWIKFLE